VVLPILRRNIATNLSRLPSDTGRVVVCELDWTVSPERWRWDDNDVIASNVQHSESPTLQDVTNNLRPPFDLIVTADTIYHPDLAQPLLRTLHHLASASPSAKIFIALERRDPTLVDAVLNSARNDWSFELEQVPRRKLAKALERRAGARWGQEDWDGVEVWKLSASTRKTEENVPILS
jgi:protein N-lysine methyltransferase METTL21D